MCKWCESIGLLPKTVIQKYVRFNAKKDDLLSLCASGVNPLAYHDFFQRLTHSRNVSDSIPETAVEDDSIDDDD